jgi:hypothetical protein
MCFDTYSLCDDERKCEAHPLYERSNYSPNNAVVRVKLPIFLEDLIHITSFQRLILSLKSSDSSLLIRPTVNSPHNRDYASSYSLKPLKGGLAATFSPHSLNPKPYPTLCLTPSISTSSLLIHQVSYQEARIKNKQISFMSAETSGRLGCRVSCTNSQ